MNHANHVPASILVLCRTSISQAQVLPNLIPYAGDSLWGYSDRSGHVRIAPQWKEAGFFKGDKARVNVSDATYYCFALINKKGEYIIPPALHWNGEWHGWKGASFNITTSDGGHGMVDANGRILITPRFGGGNYAQFHYSRYWKQYVMQAYLDGKAGIIDTNGNTLIPFEYDQVAGGPESDEEVSESASLQSLSQGMRRLLIAKKDGKFGVIDVDNHIVVPFDKYSYLQFEKPCWISCSTDFNHYGILDTAGHAVIPPVYSTSLRAAGPDYFIAGTATGKIGMLGSPTSEMGLINHSNVPVLPFRYSFITLQHDTLTVAVEDSRLPPEYPGWHSDRLRTRYTRKLNSRTLKPFSDWQLTVWEEPFEGCSGTGASRMLAQESRMSRPCIGAFIQEFTKDSIAWQSVRAAGPGHWFVQGYRMGANHRSRGPYTAIVNERLQYQIGPIQNGPQLYYLNTADKLVISGRSTNGSWYETPNQYAVLDYKLREVIPFLGTKLLATFRWKDRLYAMVPKNYENGPFGNDLYYETYPDFHLITSSGKPFTPLISYMLHSYYQGARPPSDTFSGSLLASDSLGRQGVVSLEGKVLMPRISFKAKELRPLGEGLFLIGSEGVYSWVNAAGQEVIPGLRVHSVSAAGADAYSGGPQFYKTYLKGIYLITTWDGKGKFRSFYATRNGVAHTSRLG